MQFGGQNSNEKTQKISCKCIAVQRKHTENV